MYIPKTTTQTNTITSFANKDSPCHSNQQEKDNTTKAMSTMYTISATMNS